MDNDAFWQILQTGEWDLGKAIYNTFLKESCQNCHKAKLVAVVALMRLEVKVLFVFYFRIPVFSKSN